MEAVRRSEAAGVKNPENIHTRKCRYHSLDTSLSASSRQE